MSAAAGGRRGIQRRVTLLVGAGALVPMALVAWAASASLADLEGRREAEQQAVAAAVAAGLDHHLREEFAHLSAIPSAPGFDLLDADPAPECAALHAARLPSRHLASVSLAGADGAIVCQEPVAFWGRQALAALPDVQVALRSGKPAVSRLLPGPPPSLFLLVPFRDWQGRPAGIIAGAVDPAGPGWSALLGPAPPGSGSTDLVEESGVVLASTGARRLVPASSAGPALAATALLSAAPWRVVVSRPKRENLGLRGPLLMLGPAVLATVMLFAWGTARSLTRPLAVLDLAAGRIAAGDLTQPIRHLGDDEVGSLGRSFEAMRVALAESRQALDRERGDLERRVAERTRELGQLLRKTISAQEDERKRIARELHDETCQTLVALGLRFAAALVAPAPEAVRERLVEAKALAAATLEEVHRLIFDLRPSILDDLGLVPAIRWLASRQLEPLGIAVRFEIEELEGRLPPEAETALFRAVQEALNNVARHAQAETVLIQLARLGESLEIEIEDDGKGFDPAGVADAAPSGRGLGLMGIRERLELLGGTAQIDSSPGQGTRVVLRVPLPGGNGMGGGLA
jgi:signal transduction histidine kinase